MRRVTTDAAPRVGIAILAKAPIPGLAKTRLIPHLGAAGAAALQSWLLQRTVATALAADIGPVNLWCAPDMDCPEFAGYRADKALRLRQQADGDLGQRMWTAIAESTGVAATLVIGTDCPVLTPLDLRQAATALSGYPAVVTPAEDGGYVLIGLRKAAPEVFSRIDWSTEKVLLQTRQRLHALGWPHRELATLWDVDRPEDLLRLARLHPDAVMPQARPARLT